MNIHANVGLRYSLGGVVSTTIGFYVQVTNPKYSVRVKGGVGRSELLHPSSPPLEIKELNEIDNPDDKYDYKYCGYSTRTKLLVFHVTVWYSHSLYIS